MKNMIKIHRKVRLKDPCFIAAWPGLGNVALKSATYLLESLSAIEFASLETTDLFYPDQAWINEGVIQTPRFPKGKFYYWKNPASNVYPKGSSLSSPSKNLKNLPSRVQRGDLIIFISDAQPAGDKGYFYAHKIMELAESFCARKIFTFAALPTPIEHTQAHNVFFTTTDKNSNIEIKRFNLRPMETGQISGLNGLLLAVAKERHRSGICLLGEIPLYTIQIDNPKASLAILEALSKILGLTLDLGQLRVQAQLQEEEIDRLIDYFRGSGEHKEAIGEEEVERIKNFLASYTKLPNSIKERIEKMFGVAGKDISRAGELKKELDKWSVYKDYEDRFLDLFKNKKKSPNQ